MFEKIYVDGPPRERVDQIEKHLTIEKPDPPYFVRDLFNKKSTDLVFKEPVISELSPTLKEKFDLAVKITKETRVIDLRGHDEKKSSKATKRKPKKNNT